MRQKGQGHLRKVLELLENGSDGEFPETTTDTTLPADDEDDFDMLS
jgi:hypothetical protein